MFTDRSATQLPAGEVRQLLDEYDTVIRLRAQAEAERDRLRIAITRAMGACVDAGSIVVQDEPEQLEDAIKALIAERDNALAAARILRDAVVRAHMGDDHALNAQTLECLIEESKWIEEPSKT